VPTLALHERHEATQAPNQTHSYTLSLTADTWVELRIEQMGIELTTSIAVTDGTALLKTAKPVGLHGTRLVSFIAPAAGGYPLEIRPSERGASGPYAVTLAVVRAPTAEDRALEEARRLAADVTESMQRGKYDEALAPATRSIELREAVLGRGHPLVADSLHVL